MIEAPDVEQNRMRIELLDPRGKLFQCGMGNGKCGMDRRKHESPPGARLERGCGGSRRLSRIPHSALRRAHFKPGVLQKRAAPTVWQYYPDAEHGFMHRKEPAANPAASVIASPQLVAFLKACLS